MKLELTHKLAQDAVLGYPRLGFWLDPYLDTDNTLVGYGIVFTHNGTTISDPLCDETGRDMIDPMEYYGIAPEMAVLLAAHNFDYEMYRGTIGEDADNRFRFIKHVIQMPVPVKAAEFLPLLGFHEHHTGGGCMAYQWYDSKTEDEILVTEHGGSGLPTHMCFAYVGLYQPSHGTDPVEDYSLPKYRCEFPTFGEIDVPIPGDWEDVSWHNDICPSFRIPLASGNSMRVFVDFKDKAAREDAGQDTRFAVNLYDKDEEWQRITLKTDDWDAVLAHVNDWKEIGKGLNLTGTETPTRVGGLPETVWIAKFGSPNYEFTAVGLTEQEALDTMKKLLRSHTVQLNLNPDWYTMDDVNTLEARIGAGYRDYSELRLDGMHMGRRD